MDKILIFDSNDDRGKSIKNYLEELKLSATHYRQFNGENTDSLTGVWKTHKDNFNNCIKDFKYIFMHYSNDQFSYALNEISNDKFVIVYSGGGNVDLGISKENVFPFQGKVTDAKTEWDLEAFALALANGGNIFEALQSFDPKLEELLQPFAIANPFLESDELKEAKQALNDHIKSKA